jgi:hypothetical protein
VYAPSLVGQSSHLSPLGRGLPTPPSDDGCSSPRPSISTGSRASCACPGGRGGSRPGRGQRDSLHWQRANRLCAGYASAPRPKADWQARSPMVVSLSRACRRRLRRGDQRNAYAQGTPHGRDGATAFPPRPPADATSARSCGHPLDGPLRAAGYGRPGSSPPRASGGQELSVPTHNRHLQGEWRRRESNPRPQPRGFDLYRRPVARLFRKLRGRWRR